MKAALALRPAASPPLAVDAGQAASAEPLAVQLLATRTISTCVVATAEAQLLPHCSEGGGSGSGAPRLAAVGILPLTLCRSLLLGLSRALAWDGAAVPSKEAAIDSLLCSWSVTLAAPALRAFASLGDNSGKGGSGTAALSAALPPLPALEAVLTSRNRVAALAAATAASASDWRAAAAAASLSPAKSADGRENLLFVELFMRCSSRNQRKAPRGSVW